MFFSNAKGTMTPDNQPEQSCFRHSTNWRSVPKNAGVSPGSAGRKMPQAPVDSLGLRAAADAKSAQIQVSSTSALDMQTHLNRER